MLCQGDARGDTDGSIANVAFLVDDGDDLSRYLYLLLILLLCLVAYSNYVIFIIDIVFLFVIMYNITVF